MSLRPTWRSGAAPVAAVVVGVCAASCIAVLDPDDYLEGEAATSTGQGSGGGDPTSTSTGQGPGGGDSTSSSSGGGAAGCDADLAADPDHCGACGWSCGPGIAGEGACVAGVCASFRIDTDPTGSLAVIDGNVLRIAAEATVQEIEIRDAGFEDGTSASLDVSDFGYVNPKIARTTTAVEGQFIVSSLNPVVGAPQGVLLCGLGGLGCEERLLEGDVVSDVSPSSVAFAGGTLYWTFNTAETRVRSVPAADCVGGPCNLTVASGPWAPPGGGTPAVTPRPSSLRTQVLVDGTTRLWWTLHDFGPDGTTTTCVHAWDITAGPQDTVPCVVEDEEIFTLVAAGPNVFYSTDVGGEGLIHRVVPEDGGTGWRSGIINLSVRHPLEVDEDLLYAYSGRDAHALVAARPRSPDSLDLDEAGRVLLDADEKPVHLEASHPDYLFFTTCRVDEDDVCLPETSWRLHRWRKPAPRPD